MKIKMLEDADGSPDGTQVLRYLKDEVHEVTEELGKVFVKYKHAKRVTGDVTAEATPAPEPIDVKAAAGPEENK